MSSWKLVKAVMGAQLIWVAIATIVMVVVGLFIKDEKVKKTTTKDGFQSNEMQAIYDNYAEKAKRHGN